MKTLNLSKWIITAGLTLAGLFTLPAAQASVITWIGQGTISDDTFLTNAGPVANEVYGFDNAAAGSLTTANGYTFGNANFTIAGGGASPYNGYLNGQTSGDASLNTILANGAYGSQVNNSGTLLNLTIGQTYNVMAFIDDNRGNAAGGVTFEVNGAVGNTSPTQLYGTYGSTAGNPLGGYIMGTFTADATTQAFSVQNSAQNGSFSTGNAQYNGILLEEAVPEPSTYALLGGGMLMLMALRRKM